MSYSYTSSTDLGFDEVVTRVKEAFKEQGFGVLTEIDIQATLEEKLGVDTDPYLIIGACNPGFASQALAAEPGVGVFLPCNVVVRRAGGRTLIEAMDPRVMGQFFSAPGLGELIDQVAPRVEAAVAAAAGH